MNQQTSILEVFERYGFSLIENSNSKTFISDLQQTPVLVELKKDIFNLRQKKRITVDAEFFLKEYTVLHLMNRMYCVITDFDLWMKNFEIEISSLPFPKDYLIRQVFFFLSNINDSSSFVVSVTNTEEIARSVRKPIEEVRKELVPSYELKSLFGLNEAVQKADDYIKYLIQTLDNLPTELKMNQFKQELFEAALYECEIDKTILIASVDKAQLPSTKK